MARERWARVTSEQVRETARAMLVWVIANTLAGGAVGIAIALFSREPGALERFIPMGILFGNAIGFAAVLSARFVLPRYSTLPRALRIPLAVITLLAGGAFGSALVIIFYPLTIFYQARLLLLLVVVDSMIAVVLGLIVFTFERMRDEIEAGYRALSENRIREERLREMAARSELKALKAQINPHFLFNALNSISALISADPRAAQATLERLAGIFRGTLLASERESVTLGRELELIDAYLDVERARFGARLDVRESIDPAVRDVQIPPLVIQPIVENAVRHGISPRVEGGTISIGAAMVEGGLRIVIEDDGAGPTTGNVEKMMEGGFGLRNVRDRLRTRFGDGPWLTVLPGEKRGTRVEVLVPLDAAAPGGPRRREEP
jgi:sensor histidine kinase YesM